MHRYGSPQSTRDFFIIGLGIPTLPRYTHDRARAGLSKTGRQSFLNENRLFFYFPLGCQEKSADFLRGIYTFILKTRINLVPCGTGTDCRSRVDFPAPMKTSSEKSWHFCDRLWKALLIVYHTGIVYLLVGQLVLGLFSQKK
eukprot:SAG11_NODE_2929_length_2830_cov_8.013914_1_plen_142_part_00